MATATFTLKRNGPTKEGDMIAYEAVDMATGTLYGGEFIYTSGSWKHFTGVDLNVSEIDDNTVSVTLTLQNIGALVQPKMIYLPSPYYT